MLGLARAMKPRDTTTTAHDTNRRQCVTKYIQPPDKETPFSVGQNI